MKSSTLKHMFLPAPATDDSSDVLSASHGGAFKRGHDDADLDDDSIDQGNGHASSQKAPRREPSNVQAKTGAAGCEVVDCRPESPFVELEVTSPAPPPSAAIAQFDTVARAVACAASEDDVAIKKAIKEINGNAVAAAAGNAARRGMAGVKKKGFNSWQLDLEGTDLDGISDVEEVVMAPAPVAPVVDLSNEQPRTVGYDKSYSATKKTQNTIILFYVHGFDVVAVSSLSHNTSGMRKALTMANGMVECEFHHKLPSFTGTDAVTAAANAVAINSWEASSGTVVAGFHFNTRDYDIASVANEGATVLETIRDTFYAHLIRRGVQVLLIPDIQPSSAICTTIEIARMVEARGKTLADHLADPECYLVGPDQNLSEMYAEGKKLCVEWARAKDARRGKLIRKKAQVSARA